MLTTATVGMNLLTNWGAINPHEYVVGFALSHGLPMGTIAIHVLACVMDRRVLWLCVELRVHVDCRLLHDFFNSSRIIRTFRMSLCLTVGSFQQFHITPHADQIIQIAGEIANIARFCTMVEHVV